MSPPTKIIERKILPWKGRKFLWVCDNGETYSTTDLAAIMGITMAWLIKCADRYGPTNPILWTLQKKKRKNRVLTCEAHEIVMHKGQKVWVDEVYSRGFEARTRRGREVPGERAFLIVCRILPDRLKPEDGQILKNNPFLIDDNWTHLEA